jgi:hypothetical protein
VSSLSSLFYSATRQRRGGTGKTPHPASTQPLHAPGLAGPVQPGQRLQKQRLQYGSNGTVHFPRHAQVAVATRALCPFLLTRGPASRDPASNRKQVAATRTTTRPSTQRSTPHKAAAGSANQVRERPRALSLLHCMFQTKLPGSCLVSQRLLARKSKRTAFFLN